MIDLQATAEKIRSNIQSPSARVWVAADAKVPHIRVYFGEDYVRVYETDDGYTWDYIGKGSIKSRDCIAKVEAAL